MILLPESILRLVRYFVFAVLFIGISGCSIVRKYNPFSSSPAPQAETTQSLTTESVEIPPVEQNIPESSAGTKTVPLPEVTVEKPKDPKPTISSVEIIWQVPGEPVEKYHLAYGTEKTKLDRTRTLPVGNLEKIDHPTFGPVFRYLLGGIPSGSPLFFTIQAENQYGISPKSPVQEIK